MLDLAQILSGASAALLVAALATWMNLFRGPVLRPIDGRARLSGAQRELGAGLLVLATGVSAIAAVLAIAGWISG